MAFVTPDGQFMDMDTGPAKDLAAQLTEVAATFTAGLSSALAEADAIESTIGFGPMGREFVRNIRQPLEDTKEMAERLGALADERARTFTTVQGIYVTAAEASAQAFGNP